MATYAIAPSTGSEIGMAQMRYGLQNKANYNSSNLYTAGNISLRTISQSPGDYQSELVSQTWNTASPYGFDELAGQTWNDQTPFNLNIYAQPQTNNNCSAFTATIKKNGTIVKTITKTSGNNPVFSPTGQSFSVVDTDVILIEVDFEQITGAGCITNYSETTVGIKTGSTVFNWTVKASDTGGFGDSLSYQFTASLSEAYVDLNHVPVI